MPDAVKPGSIVLLDGPSSSGKSTLAQGLQAALDRPFWHFSIDHLRAAKVLPWQRIESGEFPWADHREAFFEGFHNCLPALARAGNHLIVEHIVETEAWRDRLVERLAGLDVFAVGLRCEVEELERRERERGDRRIGEARTDWAAARSFTLYDLEIDANQDPAANVELAVQAWRCRTSPSAFDQMFAALSV